MKQLERVWLIALKDLKIFLQDRGAAFFFIIFPLMFIVLFNTVMQGIGGEDQRLELHLVTQEAAGGLSYQILGAMETRDESLLKPGEPKIIWDKDYNAACQAVGDKKLAGFIAFPADFTTALMSRAGTSLQVFADAGNVNTRAALNGLAGAISSQISGNHVIIEASIALLIEGGVIAPADTAGINKAVQRMMAEYFSGAAGAGASYITFKTDKVGEVEAENPANFVIPGYLVMFVFFAAAMASESIVRERLNYTLERLLASSVKKESILGGVYLGGFFRGLVQVEGHVQGRHGHGLEKAVEQGVQQKEDRGFRHPGPQFPPGLGPAHQGGEVFRRVAAHRGQELLPEGDIFVELNLQVKAEDAGMLPQESHPGQQGFLQAHEQAFLPGLVFDRGEGAPHPLQGELEDVPEDAFFIGKILVE